MRLKKQILAAQEYETPQHVEEQIAELQRKIQAVNEEIKKDRHKIRQIHEATESEKRRISETKDKIERNKQQLDALECVIREKQKEHKEAEEAKKGLSVHLERLGNEKTRVELDQVDAAKATHSAEVFMERIQSDIAHVEDTFETMDRISAQAQPELRDMRQCTSEIGYAIKEKKEARNAALQQLWVFHDAQMTKHQQMVALRLQLFDLLEKTAPLLSRETDLISAYEDAQEELLELSANCKLFEEEKSLMERVLQQRQYTRPGSSGPRPLSTASLSQKRDDLAFQVESLQSEAFQIFEKMAKCREAASKFDFLETLRRHRFLPIALVLEHLLCLHPGFELCDLVTKKQIMGLEEFFKDVQNLQSSIRGWVDPPCHSMLASSSFNELIQEKVLENRKKITLRRNSINGGSPTAAAVGSRVRTPLRIGGNSRPSSVASLSSCSIPPLPSPVRTPPSRAMTPKSPKSIETPPIQPPPGSSGGIREKPKTVKSFPDLEAMETSVELFFHTVSRAESVISDQLKTVDEWSRDAGLDWDPASEIQNSNSLPNFFKVFALLTDESHSIQLSNRLSDPSKFDFSQNESLSPFLGLQDQLKEEVKAARDKLLDAQRDLALVELELRLSSVDNFHIMSEITDKGVDWMEALEQLHKANTQVSTLQFELREIDVQQKKLEQQIAALCKKHSTIAGHIQEGVVGAVTSAEKVVYFQEQAVVLAKKREEIQAEHKTIQSELDSQQSALRKQLDSLNKSFVDQKSKIEDARKKFRRSEQELFFIQKELKDFELQHHALCIQQRKLKLDMKTIGEQWSKVKEENEDLAQRVLRFQERIEAHEKELNPLHMNIQINSMFKAEFEALLSQFDKL